MTASSCRRNTPCSLDTTVRRSRSKVRNRRSRSGFFFVAVQWMDVLWAGFVALGLERFRVVPGFTATNALDLYYMPFTHSLPGAAVLSLVLGAVVSAFFRANRGRVLLIVALAVFSHWLIDLIVHVPDLALWDDSYKVGFGLWNYFWIALALEFTFLIAGAWYYARIVPSARPSGDFAFGVRRLHDAAPCRRPHDAREPEGSMLSSRHRSVCDLRHPRASRRGRRTFAPLGSRQAIDAAVHPQGCRGTPEEANSVPRLLSGGAETCETRSR